MKASQGSPGIELPTTEVNPNGSRQQTRDEFRVYPNLQEYYASYARLICSNDRYRRARGQRGEVYFRALAEAGYSTESPTDYVKLGGSIYNQLGCK